MAAALPNSAYTMGWICALAVELAAARAMLDSSHGKPSEPQHAQDSNIYYLGSVGGHNVVIACLPAGVYGTSSAATVATQMLFTFPSIRFGLMVGIGGAIPGKDRDIRLGDVVVSKPEREVGGVVQYDLGKAMTGQFKRTGCLNKPPVVLLNAVGSLQAEHMLDDSKIPEYISDMLSKRKAKFRAQFCYQGAENDVLYEADYAHNSKNEGTTCEICDASKALTREDRESNDPVIHYGIIASGNQVIKDSKTRDRIGQDSGAICFEMEAAGLMDTFPCLIVRGICDYSDSHKHKRWQPYAAVTAAAYAKELLEEIAPHQIDASPTATDAIKNNVREIRDDVKSMSKKMAVSQEERERKEMLHWLTRIDYGPRHSDHYSKRQSGTGIWFTDSLEFNRWKTGEQDTLCCSGIPGAGKSVITSIAIEHLRNAFPVQEILDHTTGIAFIYFSYTATEGQGPDELVSAIIKQLITQMPFLPDFFKSLYGNHARLQTRPPFSELLETLALTVQWFSGVFLMIDALDESVDGPRKKLLSEIRRLQKRSRLKLMVTSRIIPRILDDFQDAIPLNIEASQDDVGRYLDVEMPLRLPEFVYNDQSLVDSVRKTISGAVCGMFLLARLHLDSLADKISPKEMTAALGGLPRGEGGLSEAYENAMERITVQAAGHRKLAIRVLSWITHARRSLSIRELQTALAVEEGSDELDRENIPDPKIIISVCAGLATFQHESNTVELVHLTTKEYFNGVGSSWVTDGSRDIAMTCLTYLSYNTFASGLCSNLRKLQIRKAKNELLEYAACFWASHVSLVQAEVKHAALPFLRDSALVSACFQADDMRKRWRCYRIWNSGNLEVTGAHMAILYNLEELFVHLLAGSQSVDARDSAPWHAFDGENTLLMWAAASGQLRFMEILLSHGADVHLYAKNGYEAIHHAVYAGHANCVKLLMQNGAEAGFHKDGRGNRRNILAVAVEKDFVEVVQALVENGANANAEMDGYGVRALQMAARDEKLLLMDILLKNGSDINGTSLAGETALHHASKYNQLQAAQFLLDSGANIEAADRDSKTALDVALVGGHAAVAEMLINRGARLNDKEACVPRLHRAVSSGDQGTVRLLLEQGAKVDCLGPIDVPGVEEKTEGTALWLASLKGHVDIVQALLEEGADMEAEDSVCGATPLDAAAMGGREEVVRLLLGRGACVQRGLALQYAAGGKWFATGGGFLPIVQLLLEHGADVNCKDEYGRTALHLAVSSGSHEVAWLLLASQADVQADDEIGDTALHYVVPKMAAEWDCDGERPKCLKMMILLLDHAPEVVDVRNQEGETMLHQLVRDVAKEPWAAVRVLLDRNADVNAKRSDGQTPLHLAVIRGKTKLVKRLVEEAVDVDVNVLDQSGRTALFYARRSGCTGAVEALLANGATLEEDEALCQQAERVHEASVRQWLANATNDVDFHIDMLDTEGRTALHRAAERGYAAVVRLLLEHGAQVDVPWGRSGHDSTEVTALYLAVLGAYEAVIWMLLEHGASVRVDMASKAVQTGRDNVVQLLVDAHPWVAQFALCSAAECGNEQLVRLLLCRGALGDDKLGVLRRAATNGHEAVVRVLLENGASVEAMDGGLRGAVASDSLGVARLLLQHGATADASVHRAAVERGSVDLMRALLDAGPLLEAPGHNGISLLHTAVSLGHEQMICLLLDHGADINAPSRDGRRSLHYVFDSPSLIAPAALLRLLRLLLTRGAAVDLADENGETCLHRAAAIGNQAIAQLLMENGASIHVADESGQHPLHHAAQADGDNAALVQLLLRRGTDACAADDFGRTPVHAAASAGNEAVIRLLSAASRMPVDARNAAGETALHLAAAGGHCRTMELLLGIGAVATTRDYLGHTCLHHAAAGEKRSKRYRLDTVQKFAHDKRYTAAVQLLLARNVDLFISNQKGETADDLASEWMHSVLSSHVPSST